MPAEIATPVLSDVRSAITASPCCLGTCMTITGRCLCGAIRWEARRSPVVTRVCWCRECQYIGAGSGTVNACFRTAAFTVTGTDQRLSKCRGQWQPNAPAILPVVRDAALQRGRGAAPSDLRPRRHFRRSESRQSCDDDLDVVCAALGLHQRRVAASGEATTAGGVMSDGLTNQANRRDDGRRAAPPRSVRVERRLGRIRSVVGSSCTTAFRRGRRRCCRPSSYRDSSAGSRWLRRRRSFVSSTCGHRI